MKNCLIIALVIAGFLTTANNAIGQIGTSQWRIHFSAFNTQGITETANNIYMACSNGIIRYDLEDNSVNQLTVTNGLSDLSITSISSNENTVAIGYLSGNLDIIEGNVITNIPWIESAEISGDKTVHNLYFKDSYIYVSTGIGLILYDNEKKEIKDTYYPYENPVVYDATIHNDTLYVATQRGIYYAQKDKPFLNDFEQWEQLTDLPATVVNESFSIVESFQDQLVFAYETPIFNADTIYYKKGSTISKKEGTFSISKIKAQGDRLIISLSSSIVILNENLEQTDFIYNYPAGVPKPIDCLFNGETYWIADNQHGLVKAFNNWDSKSIFNNSPSTDGSYRMDIQYGKLVVAGGGLTENLENIYSNNGVYVFENEEWNNYNTASDPLLVQNVDFDFISAAVNQNNTDEFAFSSFSGGGLKIVKENGDITDTFTSENSVIELVNGRLGVSGMKYDDDGNLWIINKGIEPLKVFMKDGQQYSFSLGSAAKEQFPYRLLIDNDGNKWIAMNNVGLIAFNENGTFDDTSDDQMRTLFAAEGAGNLPSIYVKGLAQDADGKIWIGTEAGLVILNSRDKLYDGTFGEFDAQPIKLEVNGEVERLLGETYVTSIAVDGGNRKWVGTSSSGVFCFSENGTEEIYRFNTENSPLISNNILDIKIDQLSGEVYFATDKGLVSYRADASLADDKFSSVSVFPNPVRPDFTGPITIKGLGYESDVKVTDISGNLVYKTVSNGGTVIWDGKTLQGNRAQSGVYLVWSGITKGKGKNVAKILFIN